MTFSAISISLSDILVAILTIVATGLGFIIKEQREKIKIIQNQLSDKKYKLYNEIYSIFFDILKEQKSIKEKDENGLIIKIIDVKKDLFIYAPDVIVSKFLEWNAHINDKPGDIKHMRLFLELFILIRKDMGQKNTKITNMDILRIIMTTDDEFQQMKKLLS